MKKFWLWFISTLVLIILTSYINYCYYAKNINNFVGSMVDTITEKNPENLSERSAVGKSIAGKKKEDSIITRKSIVCARKVLQNIMESGTNFTRKNISERSTGDEVCGHMITLGNGVPGTAM
jgi:maltodextrin utilization protein YvdJ